jgi:flagellar motor protein MotB
MKEPGFSVPIPCREDFSKMKKDEKGRYCASCAKHVKDFSKSSGEEIIQFLLENRDKEVCGTFRKDQLMLPGDRKKFFSRLRSFALLAFITNLLVSCRVYKPTLGPVVTDPKTFGKDSTNITETAEEHLNGIRKTCPPDDVLGGSVVINTPPPVKDSVIKKDTISIKKSISETTFVHFPSGKYELNKAEQDLLVQFSKKLIANPSISIEIDGYTDGTGAYLTNQLVSRRRAEAVRSFLRDQQVRNTIIVRAHGSKNPLASNDTEEGKSINRRAEIIILKE